MCNAFNDITFFCSPTGLGHATRDSAIMHHLQNIQTKFVTGVAATIFLKPLFMKVLGHAISLK